LQKEECHKKIGLELTNEADRFRDRETNCLPLLVQVDALEMFKTYQFYALWGVLEFTKGTFAEDTFFSMSVSISLARYNYPG
jgi:hypothetical protein